MHPKYFHRMHKARSRWFGGTSLIGRKAYTGPIWVLILLSSSV